MIEHAFRLQWLTIEDVADLEAASHLFDGPVRRAWAVRFLELPTHHLCLGWMNGLPAGFVSGVEMTHPDKGTEMFLYELGVDEAARGRGLGSALARALADRAQERGCYDMWTLTDLDNVAARATYRKAGAGSEETDLVLPLWTLDGD